MLSAAVAGGVFASPPPASILAAILSLYNAGDECHGPYLLIILWYISSLKAQATQRESYSNYYCKELIDKNKMSNCNF